MSAAVSFKGVSGSIYRRRPLQLGPSASFVSAPESFACLLMLDKSLLNIVLP